MHLNAIYLIHHIDMEFQHERQVQKCSGRRSQQNRLSLEARFSDYEILYQKWSWEGVTAESLIFDSRDVVDLSDEELIDEVKTSPLLKEESQVTIKRNASGFDFVNFNFIS